MAKDSYLTKNADVAERFTAALYEAQLWVDTHSSEEIAKSIEPFFQDTDLELITTVVDRYKSQHSFATNPTLDQEEWDNLQNIMDEAGELPKRVDYSKLVDNSYAEEAQQ